MSRRSSLPALAGLAVALVATAGTAQAQAPYTGPFTGTSVGCFFTTGSPGSCNEASEGSSTASLAGLTFNGTNGLFGNAVDGSGSLVLGTFSLAANEGNCTRGGLFGCADGFENKRFRMFVSFSQPGGSTIFTSVLEGAFLTDGIGGVLIDVNASGPRDIVFAGGSFELDIDNEELLTVNIDNQATIRASVTDATVTPEPATIALLATGLAAIGGVGVVRRHGAVARAVA